jgi:pSer/pThr/pTyr-binding forkhead associated (FHA) protein
LSPKNPQKKAKPKSDPIVVEVMSGPEDGREIICNRIPFTIGRSGENSVSLRCDQLISRQHARIDKSDDGFALSDLDSTNGTFARKKRVRKTVRIDRDELFRVGGTSLRIKP